MSFSDYPAKAKSNGRCGGFYIPFAPPATLFRSSHSLSFHSIAYTRTEHICNFDGIANILRSADGGNVLPSSSQAPYRSPRRERQVSFTSPLLLSPQNLQFCGGPRWQPLSAVSGRKRYNTLDFAEQNRVPSGTLFPSGTPCQQAAARTYWMTRSRKESAAVFAPLRSAQNEHPPDVLRPLETTRHFLRRLCIQTDNFIQNTRLRNGKH